MFDVHVKADRSASDKDSTFASTETRYQVFSHKITNVVQRASKLEEEILHQGCVLFVLTHSLVIFRLLQPVSTSIEPAGNKTITVRSKFRVTVKRVKKVIKHVPEIHERLF